MKFYLPIFEYVMGRTMSQILYLGPSFYFMKCRKKSLKKSLKVTRFFIQNQNEELYKKSETLFPPNECFTHVF